MQFPDYMSGNYLVLDFETTATEHGSPLSSANKLLLACWKWLGREYSHWGSEFEQSRLLAHIEKADFIVCHNTKFEAGWLKRCGYDLHNLTQYDSMLGEKCIAGNQKIELSLAATAARYGMGTKDAVASSLVKARVCPSEIPTAMLEAYCRQDVALTEQIFLAQREKLKELALLPVMFSRCLVTPVLADIEFNGMTLDPERVAEKYSEYTSKYKDLATSFERFTGGVNFKSPKQLGSYLYDDLGFAELADKRGNPIRSSAGNRKTDKLTVPQLVAATDKQREFKKLAHEMAKLRVPVQNLEKMHQILKSGTTKIYAEFHQTRTDTHRLSSTARKGADGTTGFQFHNLDRAFKPLFVASGNGRVIIEADAPQLEFRFAAALGADSQAIRDIREGVDIHKNTADVYGCSRQDAKAKTFAPLYGASSGDKKTQAYREYFRKRYPGIFKTQQGWTYEVLSKKQLRTPWGLIFYWPDTDVSRFGYIKNTTQIFNYPVQSGATAEIIPLTLRIVWDELHVRGLDAEIVNTIHDSIIIDCAEACLPEVKEILVDAFIKGAKELYGLLYGVDLGVPLGVGMKVGRHWTEGPEIKVEEWTNTISSGSA